MKKFKCSICGYVYEESAGIPGKGIAPGTKWEDLPGDFVCPLCGAPKSVFEPHGEAAPAVQKPEEQKPEEHSTPVHNSADKMELTSGELAAICGNLAKGCEKQHLTAEMEAFNKIAAYFKSQTSPESGKTLSDAARLLNEDMDKWLPAAKEAAKADGNRGAARSLVWSEKVSTMVRALLNRFDKEGDAMLESTGIYVCEICGFIYLGDTPPEICPVCKVPSFKITRVERREANGGI